MPLQSGTQWDALAHVAYDDKMYNGFSTDEVGTRFGARRLAIDTMTDKLVGRGVLLDIARLHGRPGSTAEPRSPRATSRPPNAHRASPSERATSCWSAPDGGPICSPRAATGGCRPNRARPRLRGVAAPPARGSRRIRQLGHRGHAEPDSRRHGPAALRADPRHGHAAGGDPRPRGAGRSTAPTTAAGASCSSRRRCTSPTRSAHRSAPSPSNEPGVLTTGCARRPSLVAVEDYRRAARRALPKMVWAYLDGGAEDERTMRANRTRSSHGRCGSACWQGTVTPTSPYRWAASASTSRSCCHPPG